MAQCETKSGAYQCIHQAGHKGACEAQPKEYASSMDQPCSKCGTKIAQHIVSATGNGLTCPGPSLLPA